MKSRGCVHVDQLKIILRKIWKVLSFEITLSSEQKDNLLQKLLY